MEAHSTSFLETAILLQAAIAASGGSGGGSSIISGPIASLPAAGTAGRLYIANDSNYAFYDNGTAWIAFGLLTPSLSLPTTSLFPLTPNGGTLGTSNGRVTMTSPGNGGDTIRPAVGPVPGSTPYSVKTLIATSISQANYHGAGISLYDSGSGRNTAFGIVSFPGNTFTVFLNQYTAFNSGASSSITAGGAMNPMWLKVLNNGTNLSYLTSPDGEIWTVFFTQLVADFLPAITDWGIFTDNITPAVASTAICYSWQVGTT